MSAYAPTPSPSKTLQPDTRYTVLEFLDRCDLDPQVKEFALIRIVAKGFENNRELNPFEITATGAEFLEAIEASQRVFELYRSRPVFIRGPGGNLINLSEPMPLVFTEMFNVPRKP
ncbi:MAG TPA: hypothetical protein PLR25_03675 [Planctomycetaceae bacterium]|nr:hypothetical protein [Planctomycetaceae bacterium]